MIELNGIVYNTTVQDILLEMRYQLHLNGSSYYPQFNDTEKNIMITCPAHKDGKERKPSCGVHKKTGVVHCFRCGYAVTLPELISDVFGKHDYGMFGTEWIKKNFGTVSIEERENIDIDLSRETLSNKQCSYIPDIVLDQYRYTHPYLYHRKMTDRIIDWFDLGYDKETDCITFPVRDISGNCLFVARRSIKGKYFNYPSGAHKPLYGVYELYQHSNMFNEKTVWVTESMFNCLTLWTYNIPAVALNGTGSYEQLYELSKLPCRNIVLALDPDTAGKLGTIKIGTFLKNTKIVYKLIYSENDTRDINDLSENEFFNLHTEFV